jgi:spermidine synthase
MNLSAQHDKVLILGGGDGMALREVLKYDGVKAVTLVDLDEGMIEFARDNPVMADLNKGSFNDARVSATVSEGVVNTGDKQDVLVETGGPDEVVCREVADGTTESLCSSKPETEKVATVDIFTIDADRFVSGHAGLYDVVIVDLPDPSSVELAKLYSVEFYAKIKRLLSPSGMAVVQSTSPYHAKETYLAIMRSMTAAGLNTLPYHDNVPSFGDWGWILGSPKLPQEVLYQRAESLSSFGVKTEEIEASNMQRALIFNRGWLESDRTDVSTLMDPSVFQYYVFDAWKTD